MKTPRILAATIAALLLTARAFAVTETWDGGGIGNNLSLGDNWADNSAPVSDIANTDLIFAGLVRLSPSVTAALSVRRVIRPVVAEAKAAPNPRRSDPYSRCH